MLLNGMTSMSLFIMILFQYGLTLDNNYLITHTATDSHTKMRDANKPRTGSLENMSDDHDQDNESIDKMSVFEQGETRDFLHFLRRIKYDHRQCPENSEEPVEIHVSVDVTNIRSVSEVNMVYTLELLYRESWVDSRLDYDKSFFRNKTELSLHESYAKFLWIPDTFIHNALTSQNPEEQSFSHRSHLRLREKGHILYSRRISVVADCPMDLTLFPFDVQVCKLGFESYGYTDDKVKFKWALGQQIKITGRPLNLFKIRLPDFRIKEAFVTNQTTTYATGNYSRLHICFVFTRNAGFCFVQLIIPSAAVVITSWVALWMGSETQFQDMIALMLAIIFLIFAYNETMPRVSYIKAMDVYLGVCFVVVFLALVKLTVIKYMRQKLRASSDSSDGNGLLHIQETSIVNHNMNEYTSVPIEPILENQVNLFPEDVKSRNFEKFIPRLEFTKRGFKLCHWLSQMIIFFGFSIFCLFYFIVYPNVYFEPADPDCLKENAEWSAEIS